MYQLFKNRHVEKNRLLHTHTHTQTGSQNFNVKNFLSLGFLYNNGENDVHFLFNITKLLTKEEYNCN